MKPSIFRCHLRAYFKYIAEGPQYQIFTETRIIKKELEETYERDQDQEELQQLSPTSNVPED